MKSILVFFTFGVTVFNLKSYRWRKVQKYEIVLKVLTTTQTTSKGQIKNGSLLHNIRVETNPEFREGKLTQETAGPSVMK